VAIANPVTGDLVQMTNHHWQFSVGQLRSQLGLQRLLVLNDFTALALALPELAAEHKQAVGLAQPASTVDAHSCIGLIGPGTGLGVSGLLWSGKQWTPLQGEGGHVSLAAANAKEFELIRILQQRYGHVSAERVVSGGGLVDLYHAVAMQLKHSPQEVTTAAQVLALAQQGSGDEIAKATLNQFTEFLGSVAGDLALTLGATGGIYLGGGILPKMGELFDQTLFRNRFEAKGRFKTYLQSIPVWLLQTPVSPALQGANLALHLQ